jgi:hypothetical protein
MPERIKKDSERSITFVEDLSLQQWELKLFDKKVVMERKVGQCKTHLKTEYGYQTISQAMVTNENSFESTDTPGY